MFDHKRIYSYTWRRGEDKSMIEFVTVDDRLRSKVVDMRVYLAFIVGTDHFLVVCRIKPLCQLWRHHAKIVTMELECTKNGKLQDQNVKDEYMERLKERQEWWNFKVKKVVSEEKKAWLDSVSAKTNHREKRKDILKYKLKDAESIYKDAKTRARECMKRRKNEMKER
ncbi:hypothetical protein EVAR_17413_1 [Eumeta japonica]|uniref:Uncharacterized protein n=1 Tax=Eumeta variegata TaxID=151549 RepID=A0A4C1VB42_EUMVA|nr:hypothetical protein EVAR_17413_1 [Eumeta japonica]